MLDKTARITIIQSHDDAGLTGIVMALYGVGMVFAAEDGVCLNP
jgi:hypothetical protein